MYKINSIRITAFCLLTAFLSGSGSEAASFSFSFSKSYSSKEPYTTNNRPWGNIDAYKPGVKYEQPPPVTDPAYPAAAGTYPGMMAPGNQYPGVAPGSQYPGVAPGSQYLGAAPGTGWYAANLPGIGNQASGGQPYVEVETSERVAYEQQNLVYTVRVVSNDNLKTLTPEIPRIDGASLELVDGPIASTRNNGHNRNREIVNEYRFKLTPLRAGKIEIPVIHFTGSHVANRQWTGTGNGFSIAAASPLTLTVLPADTSVKPWLPLNNLSLRMQLADKGPAKAGVPLTLTVELKARGALGSQLPSLEAQIKGDGFRAYRDSVTTGGGISRDGKMLLGNRSETYTLIPLQDGWIRQPAIQVAWWDVDTDTPMIAGMPDSAAGSSAANRRSDLSGASQDLFPAYFWAPMFIIIGLIIGYWLGAWARTRPILYSAGKQIGSWLSAAGHQTAQHTVAAGRKLSPKPYLDKARLGIAFLMPRTVKLWLCIRCIEHEDRPEQWCLKFRSQICSHLDIAGHAPITAIAEKLIQAQPQAQPARLRALAQSMDGAIYGGGPLDFPAWKKDFRYQLRPRLYRSRRARLRSTRRVLPALNPHTA